MNKEKEISIVGLLKERINATYKDPKYFNIGKIISVADNIVHITGLHSVSLGEIIEFPDHSIGMILSLERSLAIAIAFENNITAVPGDEVIAHSRSAEIGVSEKMLGRVIDPLSKPLDIGPDIVYKDHRLLFAQEPSMMDRLPINQPLMTGIKAVDTMIPIGKGQRELILGDKSSGKTQIAIDTIINQKDKDVICIYAAIGQKQSSVVKIYQRLMELDAMSYSIIVSTSSSDSCGMQYLTPFSACSIAEYFMYQGKDVLIIYDDLSKHAWAYRQISLLLKRFPGRDAYPGDIFSIHAGLLERAASIGDNCIQKKTGIAGKTGSITALPIVEIQSGDMSGYIPTNIISITDGQIYLSSDMFNTGMKPAIDSSRSVSRVGGAAQLPAIRELSSSMRLFIAQYRELADFNKLSSSIDESSRKIIERGKRADILFTQKPYHPLSATQICFELYSLLNGYLDELKISEVYKFLDLSFDLLEKSKLHDKKFKYLSDIKHDFDKILSNLDLGKLK